MEIRASDADREAVVAALQRHTAQGRLTIDEFTERVDAAYAARTHSDLTAVTADLPAEPVQPTQRAEHGGQLAVAFGLAFGALLLIAVLYLLAT